MFHISQVSNKKCFLSSLICYFADFKPMYSWGKTIICIYCCHSYAFLNQFWSIFQDFLNKVVFYSVDALCKFYILGYFQLFTTMFKLLFILFTIKMYARNNIFKVWKNLQNQVKQILLPKFLELIICNFLLQFSKLFEGVSGFGLQFIFNSKHFRDFREICLFPKNLSFKFFGSLWTKLLIHFVIIIM